MIVLAASATLALQATASAAAPGTRDLSFGDRGKVMLYLPSTIDSPALQTDAQGNIYVAATVSDTPGAAAIALRRYSADGRPDSAFGSSGAVVLQVGEGPQRASSASALAVEPDGGMVVVGSASTAGEPAGTALAAVRVDRVGRVLWAAVHPIGTAINAAAQSSGALAVARQADGKLVIGGAAAMIGSGTPEPAVVRLNGTDGSLDTSFAGTGVLIEPASRSRPSNDIAPARIESVAVARSGVVLAAGGRSGGCGFGNYCYGGPAILRAYSPSGARITSPAAETSGLGLIDQIALDRSGAILAMGTPLDAPGRLALNRFSPTGTPDASFSAASLNFPAVAQTRTAPAFGLQPDDRVVLAIVTEANSPNGIISRGRLVRLLPDGRPDASFALAETGLGAIDRLALQPNGSIIASDGSTLTRLTGGTAPGRATLSARARVRRRAARIPITCQAPGGAGGCSGTLTITSLRTRSSHRRITYGRASFSVAPGATQTVRVGLDRTARRRLGRAARRRLTVRAEATNGASRASQRRVRLSATRAALR